MYQQEVATGKAPSGAANTTGAPRDVDTSAPPFAPGTVPALGASAVQGIATQPGAAATL